MTLMATTQKTKPRRKNALGRGLGSLIPNTSASEPGQRDYFTCALDKIHPADVQPRKHFDQEALEDLAASIKESGLIQPLVVRERDGRYELIAGERRWRASQLAGLTEVPVVLKDVDDAVAFALALIENIQRQDLNPVEEAMAYERLIEEFEFTQAELAEQVGKSRSAIANSVRLLNLPGDILALLAEGIISSGHARALLSVSDDQVYALAQEIQEEGLTVRQTEQRARELKALGEDAQPEAAPELPQDDVVAEPPVSEPWQHESNAQSAVASLSSRLKTKVQWKDKQGKGRIEIYYDDYETLQAILDELGQQS